MRMSTLWQGLTVLAPSGTLLTKPEVALRDKVPVVLLGPWLLKVQQVDGAHCPMFSCRCL